MIKDTRIVKDAVFLIDDRSPTGGDKGRAQSGWDIDYRGEAKPKTDVWFALCTDEASETDVWMRRKVVPQKRGKVGYMQTFSLRYGSGYYLQYIGENDEVALEITELDGCFAVNGKNTGLKAEARHYTLVINFDLDKGNAEVYFDDVNCGTYDLKCASLEQVKLGVKAGTDTCFSPLTCKMWINYLLVDKCFCALPGELCDKWNIKVNGKSSVKRVKDDEKYGRFPMYSAVCADSEPVVVTRSFDKAEGVVCLEMKYHSGFDGINASFSLTDGIKEVITLKDNGNTLLYDGKALREHHVNVWQTLYIEADLEKGNAKIMLNGKKCGNVVFSPVKSCDGIKIEFSKPGASLEFTDVLAWVKQPEPEDYVLSPVLPKKKDYYVGMNICSLWRNGQHWGWDTISPYDENITYMGYYDDGLAEVADWEIKWMAEHGVDFELYCWYNSEINAPISFTGHSAAIHDGFFKAKYGDMMKFAIIWEAANCAHAGIEGFRNHIVPYWMDYFFSDPRYFTMDNKVLISVFGSKQLIKDFGSPEAVKDQLDYVRNEVKKLGYDGAIFMSCEKPSEEVKACGFDAVYAYNWGPQGCDPDYTKSKIKGQMDEGILHVIPTVSTGFNSIGWNRPRTPLLTTDGMGEMFRWFKEDVLPNNKGEDWKRKFIMLSTWNEYGEGTYMCPANLNGFGYLDEVRKAFTDEAEEHTDVRPDEKQLDRLGYLYPRGRRWVKSQQLEPKNYPSEKVGELPLNTEDWTPENLVEYKVDENGRLCGKGIVHDPKFVYNKPLDIDPKLVQNIRIKMRSGDLSGSKSDATLYFITDTDEIWSESKGVHCFTDGKAAGEYNFFLAEKATWKGRITGIRIDPTDGPGSFEIESITLCTDTKTPVITINGEVYNTSVPPQIKQTDAYIPYEDLKSYDALKFYHEWYYDEKTLYLVHGDKHMYFTEGKDYVTVNGEKVALPEPFFRYDSVPMLPLRVLSEICGIKCSVEGRYIRFEA